LSALFFYVVVNILAFVNQPPWHIKAVIIAVCNHLVLAFDDGEGRDSLSRVHAAFPQGYWTGRFTPGYRRKRSKARFNGLCLRL
jgi:hypothetical protein